MLNILCIYKNYTSAQNNHQKLVGNLFKIGRLSMASPS